jgi:hypothetical protein
MSDSDYETTNIFCVYMSFISEILYLISHTSPRNVSNPLPYNLYLERLELHTERNKSYKDVFCIIILF